MDFDIRLIQRHRVRFCGDVWRPEDPTLAEVLAGSSPDSKLLTFIDAQVADAWPDTQAQLQSYVAHHRLPLRVLAPIRRVVPGEAVKNEPGYVLPMLEQIAEARIDRQSYVLVIGGGAVLDAVGFAAAVAHRGVRLIRMPTTTLAQADSGVGVKNSLNAFGQKNFIGTFAVPHAVVNSHHWLTTLPQREWVAGFSEAVKVALLKDADLFDVITRDAGRLRHRASPLSHQVIYRSAMLHARHIAEGGDPFEQGSARPLDFGHWAAHRLELMTRHRLSHGEAVAIGLALDCTYAARIGMLPPDVTRRVIDTLARLGLPVCDDAVADTDDLLQGLDDFREHLGGQLTLTMLRGIAQPVDVHAIDRSVMIAAIAALRDAAVPSAIQ